MVDPGDGFVGYYRFEPATIRALREFGLPRKRVAVYQPLDLPGSVVHLRARKLREVSNATNRRFRVCSADVADLTSATGKPGSGAAATGSRLTRLPLERTVSTLAKPLTL